MIEVLESRQFFSGVITVNTTGLYIVITGDAADNVLSINETDLGDGTPSGGIVLYSPQDSLRVDGVEYEHNAYFRYASAFATKPWKIDMGSGNDSLAIVRYEDFIPAMIVRLGDGNDRFSVDSHFYADHIGPTAIDGGAGDDSIFIGNMGGNVSIFPGPGDDRVEMKADRYAVQDKRRRLHVLGKLLVSDTQGKTSVDFSDVDFSREVLISTGNSIDHVTFSRVSFKRHLFLVPRGGTDVLTNQGSAFRQTVIFPADIADDIVNGFEEFIP